MCSKCKLKSASCLHFYDLNFDASQDPRPYFFRVRICGHVLLSLYAYVTQNRAFGDILLAALYVNPGRVFCRCYYIMVCISSELWAF